ncbi:phosphate transport system permease protein [Haloferula luteola]|uniref:Phosphate transport system permease protein PstA n=1 Tax=Haloferula luteola TaxID=595692 RepID=A0A840UYF5_9BACT|nr:phosphate ABC transporter permease PstA [Haloferula luteola]MBB5349856.1 phosphate transport system permease protein [Haloferula luteola]
MPAKPSNFASTGRSRRGEPFVWLTAAGLAIGVLLTVGLLGLVVTKGLESFWPGRIEVWKVDREGTLETVAGYVVQERSRRAMDGSAHEEIQIFRGNGELYGEKFLYVDQAQIQETQQPEDLALIERLEGGLVIGRIQSIQLHDGATVEGTSSDFRKQLTQRIREASDRRDQLEDIEKDRIGRNAKEVKELRLKEKLSGTSPEITARLEALQTEFAQLDEQRTEIRQELEADHLVVESIDGRPLSLPVGELLHVFRPNEVGFFGRIGEMLRRIGSFLISDPREANTEGGVYPAIFGTVVMTLVMSLFVTPFGVIAAIYLREYAKQGPLVRAVRISVNNLAGVPSIVFGVFGLAFFIYFVGGVVDDWFFPTSEEPVFKSGGILWASLTLALLTVPVVIVATEEALAAVPRGVREAALACGASKWQAIQRVVLPASLPGILTGVILAMARGAGEVAPLMLVGVVKSAPDLPIDGTAPFIHAERQFMHLGFHIYDLGFQSPDSEAAKPMVFATTLLLITIVVVMNLSAIIIRNRLRKKYATSSF